MIPAGVALAASGLVGNCIGMNQTDRGKDYAKASIIFSIIVTSIILIIFIIFSHGLATLFVDATGEDGTRVVQSTKACLWSLFLYIFFASVKGV